jgi:hypothetical protein
LNDVPYNKNIMPEVAKYGVLNIVRDFNKSKNNKLDLRPCIVKLPNDPNNLEVDAHFHRWIEKREVIAPGGIVTYTVGIIEYGDGTIDECHPKNIKFTDRGRKI